MPRDFAMSLSLMLLKWKVVRYVFHASTFKQHTFTAMSCIETIKGMHISPIFLYGCYAKMKDDGYFGQPHLAGKALPGSPSFHICLCKSSPTLVKIGAICYAKLL